MKFSTALALSGVLATTAQACTRILVDEVWHSPTKRTRDITLWDQDKFSQKLPFQESTSSADIWSGEGYRVELYYANDKGRVWYPNGQNGELIEQARKGNTLADGKTQYYYCLWDNYDCGNYVCSVP